ncbi:hypothetical protein BH10PSE7_BH10PSE7_02190 [soil metagenome]
MATAVNQGAVGNAYIDGVLSGVKWSGSISFSFPDATSDYQAGNPETSSSFAQVTLQQREATRAILVGDPVSGTTNVMKLTNVYSFISPSITESGGLGSGFNGNGDIRLGETVGPGTAYAYYPNNNANGNGGDVWFGVNYAGTSNDYRNPYLGGYAYHTHIHELGHALGLKHSQETGGPANVAVPADKDAIEFTVMSYRSYVGAGLGGYSYGQFDAPQTFMQLDIQALQAMYGAYYGENATNSTYTWSATTGETFLNGVGQGTPGGNRVFMTIWDGGGNDTYDMSNFTGNTTIDLAPGSWSITDNGQRANLGSGNQAHGNVYNAYLNNGNLASIIENAYGGSGNNTIYGNQVANGLYGNDGNDSIYGLDGNDYLSGGNHNDQLKGGGGVDHLDGDAGDDVLKGGGGADSLHGGSGLDIVDYSDAGAAVTVNLVSQTASGDLATGDELNSIEGVYGSAYNDVVTGTTGANYVSASDGDDVIYTGGGVDTIYGGDDQDWVGVNGPVGLGSSFNGGNGIDTIGASGSGTYIADLRNASLSSFEYISYSDPGIGGFATVQINAAQLGAGFSATGTVRGVSFGDVSDTFQVVLGAATSVDLSGLTFLNFSSALDKVVIDGSGVADNITGSSVADYISGNGGDDVLNGLGGNDTIVGGAGADAMTGGAGDDRFLVNDTTDLVLDGVGQGTDTVYSAVNFTLSAGQEIEVLATNSVAGVTAINLTGNSFAQSLIGNNGANTLNGNGGGDTMTGYGGNDAYIVVNSADQVVEAAGQGSDTVYSAVNYTLAAGQSIEVLATGSVAGVTAINLTGNELAQTIYGNNGVNILNSGGGGDSLYGFGGNDTYLVGSLGDQAFESAGQGTDSVYTSSHYTVAVGQSIEVLATGSIAGVTAINLTGNEVVQTIYGNNGNNVLNGMGGSDTIWLFGGQDQVVFNTALGAGNVDTVQGFVVPDDTFWLDDAIFGALGPSVTADELRIGAAAVDGNDYLIYNSATGALSYDANCVGGAAAVQFATLSTGLALTNFDFAII